MDRVLVNQLTVDRLTGRLVDRSTGCQVDRLTGGQVDEFIWYLIYMSLSS